MLFPKPYTLKSKTFLWIAAGVLAVGSIFFLLSNRLHGVTPIANPSPSVRAVATPPHRYADPATSLAVVHIHALYFIPQDRTELIRTDWYGLLERAMHEMRAFHRLQFAGRSTLSFDIREDPIIGERDSLFYDSTDTARGNPHAWDAIKEELDRRVNTVPESSGAFTVRLVLYEGVGALGGDHQILVSSGYLGTPNPSSVFYHELGHTFGLEDAYEYEHGTPLDEDIMGLGRTRPIGQVYLSESTKKGIGLIP